MLVELLCALHGEPSWGQRAGRRLGGEFECMSQDEQLSAQCEASPPTLDAGKVRLQPLLSSVRVMSQDERLSAQCEALPPTLDAGRAGLQPQLNGTAAVRSDGPCPVLAAEPAAG